MEKNNETVFAPTLGDYSVKVTGAILEETERRLVERLWERDHTIWQPDPTEISNRLGWLDIAERMIPEIPAIDSFVQGVVDDGFTNVLLLGMGGSSLAPEVFQKVFGKADGYPDLDMLDSTDPEAVRALTESLDPETTLYVVSSKSGGTVETLSFFKHFYRHTVRALGEEKAGAHFVAVTDPGSMLGRIAREFNFRAVFENDPDIGGRFSALSHFGLIPAGLLGVDLERLLNGAVQMAEKCRLPLGENPGALLGISMAAPAEEGRDKVTVQVSPALGSLGDWIEQLIAESSGKNGTGILPVVSEAPAESYSADRFFVQVLLGKDDSLSKEQLVHAGHPVVQLRMRDAYELGAQFILWEIATALACARLGINAFDQPNVESAKVVAREMMNAYREKGRLPASDPAPASADTIRRFLSAAEPGDYVGLLAYLTPDEETATSLAALRMQVRELTGLATVSGFGPRYLHSSGQLHKGDRGNGYFIVLTTDRAGDIPIPDEPDTDEASLSFGVLISAQALGDMKALRDENRPVLHLHLGVNGQSEISALAETLA